MSASLQGAPTKPTTSDAEMERLGYCLLLECQSMIDRGNAIEREIADEIMRKAFERLAAAQK